MAVFRKGRGNLSDSRDMGLIPGLEALSQKRGPVALTLAKRVPPMARRYQCASCGCPSPTCSRTANTSGYSATATPFCMTSASASSSGLTPDGNQKAAALKS